MSNGDGDINTRSQGIRKTTFPAKTAIDDTAFFDFFSPGSNIKISKANFLAALNVTGTIVQTGPVTAVPVLDITGTVHKIRNLTGKGGVIITIDAENGIEIAGPSSETSVEVTTATYSQTDADDILYVNVTSTITMLATANASKSLTIRCIAGTTTIAPTSGTVETTTLTIGQSIRLGPRTPGWFNL